MFALLSCPSGSELFESGVISRMPSQNPKEGISATTSQPKGIVKAKKKLDGDKSKPKSILMNKDGGSAKITETPLRASGSTGTKRKLDEDTSPASGAVKARRVDKSDGNPKGPGRTVPGKEKKKHPPDVIKRGKTDRYQILFPMTRTLLENCTRLVLQNVGRNVIMQSFVIVVRKC